MKGKSCDHEEGSWNTWHENDW